jgi:endonuclease-3
MATQSKSQFLNDIHHHLKRRYKPKPDRDPGRLSILEAVVYGICHEDTTREQANQALSRFKDQFFDWNEVRVSPIAEVRETLVDIPDPEGRAQRIRRFLRQLFAKTYGFTLEPLTKKPLKEALKLLQGYEALSSDYVTATVVQQALGGHAIPVDSSTRRALERLGISEPDLPALRSVLERAVPKNRGGEFLELLEELTHDTCVAGVPDCPRCELRKVCPYALASKNEAAAAARAAKIEATRAGKKAVAKEPVKEPVKEPAKEPSREKPAPPAAKPTAKQPPPAPGKPPAAAKPTPPPQAKPPAAKQPPPPPRTPPGKRGGGK